MNRAQQLFEKIKSKGLLWSYSKELKSINDEILIEQTLKYGDFWDIKELFAIFEKEKVAKVWRHTMKNDSRFKKINLLIAKVFLNEEFEVNRLKVQNGRFKTTLCIAPKNKKGF